MKTEINIDLNKNDLHDNIIWAMKFDDALYFDIDCILNSETIEDKVQNTLVPITLKFNDVEDFKVNIACDWIDGLEIDQLEILSSDENLKIDFFLQEGKIEFTAKSYNVFAKRSKIVKSTSSLTEEERGGYNFLEKIILPEKS